MTSSHDTLAAFPRDARGSGPAHRLRKQGRIPASLMGHGAPQSLTLDAHDFARIVPPGKYGSAIVRVQIDGRDAGLALVKSVQVNTLRREILSVELQRVNLEQAVTVHVPIVLEGDAIGIAHGGLLETTLHSVSLKCRAAEVPAQITHDISALDLEETVLARDLDIPNGCELVALPDECVAVIHHKRVATAPMPEESLPAEGEEPAAAV